MAKRSNRGRQAARARSAASVPSAEVVSVRAGTRPPPLPKPLAKAGAFRPPSRTPALIEDSLHRHGMESETSLGPGRPLTPYQGYSQPPRAMDYPTSVNINIRTRASWGLPSFETLRAISKVYDVQRICINHKISELQSMPLMFLPAEGVRGDVSGAIDAARQVLEFPDRELPWEAWLSKWMENAYKFDAAPLYKRRNLAGDVIGLEVLDGTTIMPYIDERGRRPRAPAPAWYQVIKGQVWNWYTRQDITYFMRRPQEDSPFGTAPMETFLISANTDIRFQWHFLQMFTEGSIPGGFVEVPPDVSSPDQVAEWQDYWDAMIAGDQSILHRLIAVPAGTKVINTKPESFDPLFPEYLMMRCCAVHGVVPQDVGLIKDVNRANGETQTDIQFRVNTLPDVLAIQGVLSRYLRYDIGLPVQVKLDTGREKEDRLQEAQSHKLYVEMGAESPDEVRSNVLGLPVDNLRPTPRFINNARLGPIPLPSIEAVAGKTDPETHGPAADQVPLDQPYAGVIGVIPQVGTADAKASTAAVDAEQQHHRAELEAERSDAVPTVADQGATVAKAADGELAAFRRYLKTRVERGKWRDFQFTHLIDDATAQRLNADGRAAVAKAAGEPETSKQWPGWDRDLETARAYADRIRHALTGAVDTGRIASRWLAGRPVTKAADDGDSGDVSGAEELLAALGIEAAIDDALAAILSDARIEGYVIGLRASVSMTSGVSVDWGGWTPGDPASADRVLGADGAGAGLQQLLDNAGVSIKSLGQGRMDELAQSLALSLERGDSADTLARDLRDILDDDRWAWSVATTEINRAVSAATLATYGEMGVAAKEWLTAADQRVCPTCDRNAGDGPIPLAQEFTSGDNAPPAHPGGCRCALGPADLPGGNRG